MNSMSSGAAHGSLTGQNRPLHCNSMSHPLSAQPAPSQHDHMCAAQYPACMEGASAEGTCEQVHAGEGINRCVLCRRLCLACPYLCLWLCISMKNRAARCVMQCVGYAECRVLSSCARSRTLAPMRMPFSAGYEGQHAGGERCR